MKGRVVSIKMANTATVLVSSIKTHPLYKKTYQRSKKYLVQDDLEVSVGDIVEIIPTKPISRKKFWKITQILGREFEAIAKEQLKESAAQAIEEVVPVGKQIMQEEEKEELGEAKEPKEEKPKRKRGKSNGSA